MKRSSLFAFRTHFMTTFRARVLRFDVDTEECGYFRIPKHEHATRAHEVSNKTCVGTEARPENARRGTVQQ